MRQKEIFLKVLKYSFKMYLNPVFKKQYSFKMQLIKYDLSYMRYLLLGR